VEELESPFILNGMLASLLNLVGVIGEGLDHSIRPYILDDEFRALALPSPPIL
jgi:hypothetical protein